MAAPVGGERPPRPWLAALLALAYAGLGHLYIGSLGAAIGIWMGVWICGAVLFAWISRAEGIAALVFFLVLAALVRIAIAADAWRLARQRPPRPRLHGAALAATVVGFLVIGTVSDAVLRLGFRDRIADTFRVPSLAMAPTIAPGDFIFSVPLDTSALDRDEVVVYRGEGGRLVKRIAGLPGDTLQMHEGRLLRNGKVVREPWAVREDEDWTDDSSFAWQKEALMQRAKRDGYHPTTDEWGPFVVPSRHVFLLGDNRHHSMDSRIVGFIPTDSLVARPTTIYWSWSGDSSRMRRERIGRRVR